MAVFYYLEDTEADQIIAEELLQEQGHEVYIHNAMRTALDFFRDPKKPEPDILLLDININDRPVYGAIEKFHEIFPDAKIILLSGRDVSEQIAYYKEYLSTNYITAYMQKPLTTADIDKMLKRAEYG